MKNYTEMTPEQRLLNDAMNEIRRLRVSNEKMKIRCDAFDDCLALLSSRIHEQGCAMSPDVAWEIEQYFIGLDNIPPK